MKIGQEQKFASLNNAKLTEKWRTILRECKTAELHDDVKALMDSFSRALQKKDAQIKLLVKVSMSLLKISFSAFLTTRLTRAL